MDLDTQMFFVKRLCVRSNITQIDNRMRCFIGRRRILYCCSHKWCIMESYMWKKFGMDEHTCSCKNPIDDTRQLWFALDCSHLIKCFRNCVVQQKINARWSHSYSACGNK
ncbi:PREDICTED: uncharacterized protein LOC105149258 [Acromyrmex echinatior]|uniref:uncharacterized protein LOC105149258 n=1 Tax=Acromyrmex echinatior TaxID=103372 RepID=UPI000580FC28|nr:PREDICTED: uncharacterized protein LOC105149258 [Acromyrmex echinatior]